MKLIKLTASLLIISLLILASGCNYNFLYENEDEIEEHIRRNSIPEKDDGMYLRTTGTVELKSCTVTSDEDWFFESSNSARAILKSDELPSAYIEISCVKDSSDAEKRAYACIDSYGEKTTVSEVEINNCKYFLVDPKTTFFVLFADSTSESNIVKISGMFASFNDMKKQLEKIEIK